MDAPAAPVSRFQYRNPLAGASELARSHQACGTGTDDNDMVWLPLSHAGVSLEIRILQPIPQPNGAAFQHLAALKRHPPDRRSALGLRLS